jgi:hypothetical protein
MVVPTPGKEVDLYQFQALRARAMRLEKSCKLSATRAPLLSNKLRQADYQNRLLTPHRAAPGAIHLSTQLHGEVIAERPNLLEDAQETHEQRTTLKPASHCIGLPRSAHLTPLFKP